MTEHPEVFIEPHIVDELRDICTELPETAEGRPFGATSFQVRGKNYAMMHRDRDDRPGADVHHLRVVRARCSSR